MISKIKNINYKKLLPYIIVYLGIFGLLFLQHSVVNMYFDDFGNASLSYAYTIADVNGTNYNFFDLWEWVIWIFNNFGGRVLYAMIIIPLLKNGITLFMIIQTFVITAIIYYISKIISFLTKKNSFFIPVIVMLLFMLIDISVSRHGTYWASASILYIWPLLPLFSFIYYYIKTIDNVNNNIKVNYFIYIIMSTLLIFLITFSQEQIGVSLIAFLFIYVIFDHFKLIKKFLKYDLFAIIWSIITYALMFSAPGNWVRLDSNTKFASLSFADKMITNFPKIMDLFLKVKINHFLIIACSLLAMILFYYIIKNVKKNLHYLLLVFPILGLLTSLYVFRNVKVLNTGLSLSIYGTIIFSSLLFGLFFHYLKTNQLKNLSFFIAACCSVFCLLMAPYMVERAGLPFIFFSFIIIVSLFLDIFKTKNVLCIIMACCLMTLVGYNAINNYQEIYIGYKNNYEINNNNFEILANYDSNSDKKELILKKVPNSFYGSTQPYESNYDYWLQQYFDLPVDIVLTWED